MKLALAGPQETALHCYIMVVKSKNLPATGGLFSNQRQVVNIG